MRAPHRWTLAYVDDALEQAYLAHRRRRISRRQFLGSLALTIAIWGVLAVGGTRLTGIGDPTIRSAAFWVVIPALTLAAIPMSTLPVETFRRWARPVALALAVVVGLAVAASCASLTSEHDLTLMIGGVAVYLFGVHGFMDLRFVEALAASWTLVAATLAAVVAGPLGRSTLGPVVCSLVVTQLLAMRISYLDERQRRQSFMQQRRIDQERRRADDLLRNILPGPIAERLKDDPSTIAETFDQVTILFADIVGFTQLSARLPPQELVALLNQLFSAFDELAERHGLEKIKTIGDAYMVVGGLPQPRPDHAEAVAAMALEMRDVVARIARETGCALDVRIGIDSGQVVAGVIGKKKFAYDLWGDAVNTASRMESHGVPGAVHVSAATHALLERRFELTSRGTIVVKGKGEVATWFLEAPRRG